MHRVLLIDDDRDLLDLLEEWLSDRGYSVRTLADGFRAREEALLFRPDVVLLDGRLLGIAGTTVASQLQDVGQEGIIFLSGLPRGYFPSHLPVLQKPIDLDALERAINRMAT